jgi:hypothetical protein
MAAARHLEGNRRGTKADAFGAPPPKNTFKMDEKTQSFWDFLDRRPVDVMGRFPNGRI